MDREKRSKRRARGLHELRANELRVLAHPLRMALLEMVIREGTVTATRCGEQLGESPANCSYHLRQLAKHGFVVEAPGGRGRERLWKQGTVTGFAWEDKQTSPAAERATGAILTGWLRRRHAQYLADWLARRDQEPPEWYDVAGTAQFLAWLTADELRAINDEIIQLWFRYSDRLANPENRPPGARPVWSFTETFPLRGVLPPDAPALDPFAPPTDEDENDA